MNLTNKRKAKCKEEGMQEKKEPKIKRETEMNKMCKKKKGKLNEKWRNERKE